MINNDTHLFRKIIAPMLKQPYKSRSNFWGALSKDGFYVQPFDYMDIINHNKKYVLTRKAHTIAITLC